MLQTPPDSATCEQARLSRDARFDGLFFTAVTSTGIYCRPVCPAPAPKPANVRYFGSAAAAEAAGFRPCLRCRPELAPGERAWLGADALLDRALALIGQGLLAGRPVSALAARVGVGERQLRRLFGERIGASPLGVHGTRRLLFAKQLLTETSLPITDVALAAGFGSLRRFNDSFLKAYRLAPGALRRQQRSPASGPQLQLRLGYRPPLDFGAMLDFLRSRALPGVERIEQDRYTRLLGNPGAPAWVSVVARPGEHALQLEASGAAPHELLGLVTTARRMFDLDADPSAIRHGLAGDPLLRQLVQARPGLRLPGAWDGFETAVRAVLGQQVSVAAATTLANRLVARFGEPVDTPVAGLDRYFPSPERLLEADLTTIGLTRARARTIAALSTAVMQGAIDFEAPRTLDETVGRLTALPGIGDWTAHYIAMRAVGHPDAFPAADLVLRKFAVPGRELSTRELLAHAAGWRPWRAYSVIHLWRHAGDVAGRPERTP